MYWRCLAKPIVGKGIDFKDATGLHLYSLDTVTLTSATVNDAFYIVLSYLLKNVNYCTPRDYSALVN